MFLNQFYERVLIHCVLTFHTLIKRKNTQYVTLYRKKNNQVISRKH